MSCEDRGDCIWVFEAPREEGGDEPEGGCRGDCVLVGNLGESDQVLEAGGVASTSRRRSKKKCLLQRSIFDWLPTSILSGPCDAFLRESDEKRKVHPVWPQMSGSSAALGLQRCGASPPSNAY